MLLLFCEGNIREELTSWNPDDYSVRIIERSGNRRNSSVFSITVEKSFEEKPTESVNAVVLRYVEDKPIYLLLSDCTAAKFKHILTKFANKHFPKIARMFLTNNEMRGISPRWNSTRASQIWARVTIGRKRLEAAERKSSRNQPSLRGQLLRSSISHHV